MRKLAGLAMLVLVLLTVTGLAAAQYRARIGAREAGMLAGMGAGLVILWLAVAVFMVIVGWKIFEKAGEPGWAAIVPIYNIVVMLRIAGKPEWWILLMLIPFVNIIIGIMVTLAVAERFGQSSGFAVGMIFLPIIFYPILAFGDAEYQG